MTEHEARSLVYKLGVLILIGMLVQLSVIIYVYWSQYEGRKEIVTNLRAGCERGKLDRADNARIALANATNWHKAAEIRQASGDISIAVTYALNAQKQESVSLSLQKRAHIECAKAYPKASLLG